MLPDVPVSLKYFQSVFEVRHRCSVEARSPIVLSDPSLNLLALVKALMAA